MSDTIKLEWERNGPNFYAYVAEREIFIGLNDRTGKYELRIDGMGLVGKFSTVREAKARAQQEADKIYAEAHAWQRCAPHFHLP